MKTSQFNQLKQTAERLQTYAAKTNANAKKLASVFAVLDNIEKHNNVESIKKETFNAFRSVINRIPKDVRGFAKAEFCKVIDIAVSEQKDSLYFLNTDGSVNYKRVWNKVKPCYNNELFIVISNLMLDVFANAETHCSEIESNKKFDSYLATMNDELNEFSVPQLLAC